MVTRWKIENVTEKVEENMPVTRWETKNVTAHREKR